MSNTLYYGDNLEVFRKYIKDETIDLCYIDPPFNSKRNYNQIYNNIGTEDRAQAQAFVDTWFWDSEATKGYEEIVSNDGARFTVQTIELIKGLHAVLGKGSLLAYLVSMTLRIVEIQRALKPTGSFYLHCDPTASHYLKLVCDGIFVPAGGDFRNEIVWCYETGGRAKRHFPKKHDIIFWYSKTSNYFFNYDAIALPRDTSTMHEPIKLDEDGRPYQRNFKNGKEYKYYLDKGVLPNDYWVDLQAINPSAKERLGYPTQKPESLLERIIGSSSNEGDTILDAYCGCGTTIAVAHKLNRKWIGMDITYQSIALILRRLEEHYGKEVLDTITLNGIPRDMEAATALAHKKDDRVRKEFEKWAILTYTDNRAIINEKKGGDGGIDGIAYFMTGADSSEQVVMQVKSGTVQRRDIATLKGDMMRVDAPMAVFITLQERTKPMTDEARAAGIYHTEYYGRDFDRIRIVTIEEILNGARFDLPVSMDVLKAAKRKATGDQLGLKLGV